MPVERVLASPLICRCEETGGGADYEASGMSHHAATITRLRRFIIGISVLWTAAVCVSFSVSAYREYESAREAAKIENRSTFYKDLAYRRWAAGHGGVYVPVTEKTPANPYLSHLPERDLTTPSGRRLTLVNPAYMTRQVHEIGAAGYGVQGHITSLNPIRPENAPDPWEAAALEAINRGDVREVSMIAEINGADYMRLMQPMFMEEGCLKCHAAQGYKIGDLRGGISVSTPMKPHWQIARSGVMMLGFVHGLFWLAGLGGIAYGGRQFHAQLIKCRNAEKKRAHEQRQQAAQLRLIDYSHNHTVAELLQKFLDEAELLTGSKVGFFHYVEEDQQTLSLQAWSTNTLTKMCTAKGAGSHYPISEAGVWVDCVRERAAVIHNDYASLPHKKGLPEGHAPVIRELVVPVFRGEKIRAILGIGNKPSDYDQDDVKTVQEMADLAWETVERKQTQEERERLMKKLDFRNKELESIIYISTHDLRNPIVNVMGYSSELHEDCKKLKATFRSLSLPDESAKMCQRILDDNIPVSVKHICAGTFKINELIEGLLTICQLGQADPQMESVDVNGLMNEIVMDMEYPIQKSGAIVHVTSLPACQGDKTKLLLVFTNLLKNAIEYRDPGRPLKITISGKADTDTGRCVYCVEDNGIGIDYRYHDKIFKLFYQLNPDRSAERQGLGLTIVQRIVQRHGGFVTVTSEPGKGSKFFIELPGSVHEQQKAR